MADRPITELVPARAAVAGNPSDGFGGAVLSAPVHSARATVTVRPADRFEIAGTAGGGFADCDELREHRLGDAGIGRRELVLAAIHAYAAIVSPKPLAPCAIEVETTIPRSVGLAGSSAIVIATLRAIIRHGRRPALGPDGLAIVALTAEVDHLGIPAGLQDRVVQSHDAVMHMEFGAAHTQPVFGRPSGSYEVITAEVPGRLFVAHRPGTAAASGTTHRPLRERFDVGDAGVRQAMAELADHARRATTALRAGDAVALGAAMDRSFDARRSVLTLDPAHVEMIDAARAAGAAANYTGSGGAITVLAPDDATDRRARASLARLGCELLDVTDV